MSPTLEKILGKFNLAIQSDYKHVTLPIGLRMNRRQLAELFAELGFTQGAEIGTAEGEYAEVLCRVNPKLTIYCVDPWTTYSDYRDYRKQDTLNDLFEQARKRLEPYLAFGYMVLSPTEGFAPLPSVEQDKARAYLLKSFSVQAAAAFKDESLDFIYIDANHKYEYVVADIAAWLPKIKPGGVIAGHDYSKPNGKGFGVIEAVKGWTEAYNVRPWFILKGDYEAVGDRSHSWLWTKE